MKQTEENIRILGNNPNHMISEFDQENVQYKFVIGDEKSEFFQDKQGNVYEVKDEFEEQGNRDKNLKEIYFIMGINGIGEIEELVKFTNPASVFIIYEPHGEFLEHILSKKNLVILADKRIVLIVKSLNEFRECIRDIIRSNTYFFQLYGSVRFYATYFYRRYRLDEYKIFVKLISEQINAFLRSGGNSLEDSLKGFKQNAKNGKHLLKSKDITKLKDYFAGMPAFIVAAGPSLDKNINELRKVKGHSLIFAVDTILMRLLEEKIIPDFVCSIERDREIFEFFYKGKNIPSEITLIAPMVLVPEVFESFPGEVIIPFRYVKEYFWWNKIYKIPEDAYVEQGQSCATLAFGVAAAMGCSPIVLVGQDLAYGDVSTKTHATGTIYEELQRDLYEEVGAGRLQTTSYYGGSIETNQFWNDFRLWFEEQIKKKGIFTINSTEGGAEILGAVPIPLSDVVEKYCKRKIDVQFLLSQAPCYVIEKIDLCQSLIREIEELEFNKLEIEKHLKLLEGTGIEPNANQKKLLKVMEILRDSGRILERIQDGQFLLYHLMQPEITFMMIAVGRIKQELTYESVAANLFIQLRFFSIAIVMLESAIKILNEECQWIYDLSLSKK